MSDIRELHIEKLSHEGRGIARLNGKTQFVEGALPGETVKARTLTTKKSWDALSTIELLSASEDRVTPPCPHFNDCGGCQIQHLRYAKQVEFKSQTLEERLAHSVSQALPEIATISSSPDHYRTRARLACWYHPRNDEYRIGFRQEKSKEITCIESCLILHPALSKLISPLRDLVKSLKLEKSLGHIDLQLTGEQTAAFSLRVSAGLSNEQNALIQTFSSEHHCHGTWQTGELLGDDQTLSYSLPKYDLDFAFSWGDFTQANRELNQELVTLTLSYLALNDDDCLLDGFSGLGNFSLPAAKQCKKVIGVEGSDVMVESATHNAESNGITNSEFVHRNLMDDTSLKSLRKYKFTKALIDPPRDGAFVLCQWLAKQKPQRIVYVSCHSASLARDAKILVEAGYQITQIANVDMFPHSHHSEAVCCFVRG